MSKKFYRKSVLLSGQQEEFLKLLSDEAAYTIYYQILIIERFLVENTVFQVHMAFVHEPHQLHNVYFVFI